MSGLILRIYIELCKEGTTSKNLFLTPRLNWKTIVPAWCGSAVTTNKTIVMLDTG